MLGRATWVVMWLVSLAGSALAQPVWCKYARSDTERTICATPELWEVDACEDRLFREARDAAPADRKKLDGDERAFGIERDRCGRDVTCIARRYAARAGAFPLAGREACIELANATATRLKAKGPAAKCGTAAQADVLAGQVAVTSSAPRDVAHGTAIPVSWRLPAAMSGGGKAYVIGAMPDTVRFEGEYRFDDLKLLAGGPGFVALPGGAKAPFGISFGEDRTRVVIPIHDADVPRSGRLAIKPYVAGSLAMEWAVAVVVPGCGDGKAHETSIRRLSGIGPFEVGVGAAEIIVQDFTPPTPRLEVTTALGTQRLQQVELTADGRYRLEIFDRRYRVFDRTTGAKITDRSGVQPRFSPGGRFVLASIGDATLAYPTRFEVFDLVAGRVVALVTGPIVAWSNRDALLMDGGRAYQALGLFNTLIDPVRNEDGANANWPTFFPGCGTCDAWIGSNIFVDWDSLAVLRGDDDTPLAKGLASLAGGRTLDVMTLDDEAKDLRVQLRRTFGKSDVRLSKGWASNATLALTHVGRGYDGYADDDASLVPEDKQRQDQRKFLAKRRLAIVDGKVVAAEDLRPLRPEVGGTRAAWTGARSARGPVPIESGYVADEFAKLDLFLMPTTSIDEIAIPVVEQAGGSDPLVRLWPEDLKREILAASPALAPWFEKGPNDIQEKIIIAAWRFEIAGAGYLLLQHGDPAPTANGAHDLRFDIVTVSGPERGRLRTIEEIGGLFSQFVGREHTVARVFTGHEGRLFVLLPGSGKGALLDFRTNATELIDLVEPTLLCAVLEAPARGFVAQSNCDGQIFIFAPARGTTPILAGRIYDEELILYTAAGYYTATYEGAHFVHVGFPGRAGVHSFEQFARILDRPDVIRATLSAVGPIPPPPALRPPPIVELAANLDAENRLVLRVDAAADAALSAIEVHEDGRLVERVSVSGRTAQHTFSLPDRPHVRRLTALAIDSEGIKSRPASVDLPARRAVGNRLHVVAVGIDAYTLINPLKGAATDARTLVRTLGSRTPYYADVRSMLLVDQAATATAVQRSVDTAVADAGPDDTILFFYAGHGARTEDGRFYMTTSETDPDRLPETSIDWQAISGALGKARGRVIVVIDACHSGQTGRAGTTNDEAVSSIAATGGAPMVVLAASKGRQLSEELRGQRGGVFTQTLARVLADGRGEADVDRDGTLSISEVYGAVKRTVELQTDGRQTPWLVRRNIVGDAPLF